MIVRAENLTPEQKAAFESLFGRPIASEEEFLVDTYKRAGEILPSTVTDEERWDGLEAYFRERDAARAQSESVKKRRPSF